MPGQSGTDWEKEDLQFSSGDLLIAPSIVEENNNKARMEVEEDPEFVDDGSVKCGK